MTNEAEKFNKDALREQYEDALFRLALIGIEEERAEALTKELEAGKTGLTEAEMDAAYHRSLPKFHHALDRALLKNRRRRFIRQTLPRAAHIAAAALLVLFIGGSVAVAAVRPVRVQLMKLLIRIERAYTELSLVPGEAEGVEVPEGWMGDYYPAYVPEGFKLLATYGGVGNSSVQYVTEGDRWLDFGEYDQHTGTNIDTENAALSSVEIGGSPALLSEKGGAVTVAWAWADRYFIVELDGSPEEAIQIARSVQKIK